MIFFVFLMLSLNISAFALAFGTHFGIWTFYFHYYLLRKYTDCALFFVVYFLPFCIFLFCFIFTLFSKSLHTPFCIFYSMIFFVFAFLTFLYCPSFLFDNFDNGCRFLISSYFFFLLPENSSSVDRYIGVLFEHL